MFCTFWLGNVLRATTACTFPTSQLPRVVWDRGFLTFETFDLQMCFAPQRRALFHLSSGQLALHPPLYRGYFSTLRSPKSLEKHSELRLSYLFTHLHLLSSDFLHLLSFHFLTSPRWLFPPLLFHLCILSEVWLLNFKLPSIITLYIHIECDCICKQIYYIIYIYLSIYIYIIYYIYISYIYIYIIYVIYIYYIIYIL